jgi:hypothetical protein
MVTHAAELRELAAELDEGYLLGAMPFDVRRYYPMAAQWLREMAALRDAGVPMDTAVYLSKLATVKQARDVVRPRMLAAFVVRTGRLPTATDVIVTDD